MSDAPPAGRREAPAPVRRSSRDLDWAVPTARLARAEENLGSASRDRWAADTDPEPELLTRPMRLGDRVPHSRRPRLDGSLSGV